VPGFIAGRVKEETQVDSCFRQGDSFSQRRAPQSAKRSIRALAVSIADRELFTISARLIDCSQAHLKENSFLSKSPGGVPVA